MDFTLIELHAISAALRIKLSQMYTTLMSNNKGNMAWRENYKAHLHAYEMLQKRIRSEIDRRNEEQGL